MTILAEYEQVMNARRRFFWEYMAMGIDMLLCQWVVEIIYMHIVETIECAWRSPMAIEILQSLHWIQHFSCQNLQLCLNFHFEMCQLCVYSCQLQCSFLRKSLDRSHIALHLFTCTSSSMNIISILISKTKHTKHNPSCTSFYVMIKSNIICTFRPIPPLLIFWRWSRYFPNQCRTNLR